MTSENIFTIVIAILTMIGSIVGVWAVTRKNASEVAKQKALSEVRTQDAESKERADLIELIREHTKKDVEHTKQGAIWLESLKVIENTREKDYATLKAIIEDGTKETINSRKELTAQAKEHNTGVTKTLDEVKKELSSIKTVVDSLPGENAETKRRIDALLGYIERLLPRLRTGEVPAATPNGAIPEVPSSAS